MEVEYLTIADYLLIAEAVTNVRVEPLAKMARIGSAESALRAPAASFGGNEFYPEVSAKAAVLCSRLVRNHPLPDGNKRAAFISMLEFLERNGYTWRRSPQDPDETAETIEGVASGEVTEEQLEEWIRARMEKQPTGKSQAQG